MNFFTISTFRDVVASLIKKPREGYSSVVADICAELQSMPDNILRDTNERIIQTPEYRVVKLRVANSNLKLSKSNGFRLVYLVSLITDYKRIERNLTCQETKPAKRHIRAYVGRSKRTAVCTILSRMAKTCHTSDMMDELDIELLYF